MYSTAAADAVAACVQAEYDLAGPVACQLLHRGFNDLFAVRAADARYILRLSGPLRRGDSDVPAELAFLAHLDAAGVPVAAAVPTRAGALLLDAALPEAARPAVLFRFIEGRTPGLDDPDDAWVQGVTLARIHDVAAEYSGREAGHRRLDLDRLLHRPLAAVCALEALPAATRDVLQGLGARLAARIAARDGLTWTRCHGDCHGLNARIATDGPRAGQAVFFDFDDGGFGYLAYDLAVHLWAQISFGRQRYRMWHAFIDGYRTVRPIAAADFEAIALFVPLRHIWLMGGFAARVIEWGSETLPASWLDRETGFLTSWESARLSGDLLGQH